MEKIFRDTSLAGGLPPKLNKKIFVRRGRFFFLFVCFFFCFAVVYLTTGRYVVRFQFQLRTHYGRSFNITMDFLPNFARFFFFAKFHCNFFPYLNLLYAII